jgi:hypothetical protein
MVDIHMSRYERKVLVYLGDLSKCIEKNDNYLILKLIMHIYIWCIIMVDIIGFQIPLWAVFLGGLIVVVVAWKLIKFAIKLLIVLVIFFALLIGLDMIGVFQWIQDLIGTLL